MCEKLFFTSDFKSAISVIFINSIILNNKIEMENNSINARVPFFNSVQNGFFFAFYRFKYLPSPLAATSVATRILDFPERNSRKTKSLSA